ncbi:MAG: glycosyltransferase family 2 protein [Gammaproteobacteria bacterium]|jgi:glycosyltransferase involved in cell wall biosynthesis|nr:glycosyltransferase family 2 protein [Gammaproteobacteria bacterium]MBT4146444.1 glycosyltransferase family 2 protein [Gammaproteobacteria bacterium]MBT5221908.1 glycosyltransferase family 2 protein [Gammaproteobacteria bacterium]MBT5824934.1 glycosyltransferase family 2 protein [Gammaproteobacteria bacterium]MBT6419109.1 glycosyltransferase family 2 protein [Gammaproteobacteria bacterium]
MNISIVLPAKNEAKNITAVLQSIQALELNAEILVINDGSTDNTAELAELAGAKVISHPYSQGNGAAIKTGARIASGDITVFMDGDGQHNPADIPMFLQKMEEGYDMVVGARNVKSQASLLRRIGNAFYNRFATIMTGHKIEDLTSGFRAVRTDKFRKFLYLLPNGFSYPTTSTMAFFRSGFPVAYVPIHAGQRKGKSHIRLFRDGARFFIIILRIGSLFSPMRLFLPISTALFLLGMGYYGYTYVTMHRFTNMSALLLNTSVITFLMGFLSEQVSALHYRHAEDD